MVAAPAALSVSDIEAGVKFGRKRKQSDNQRAAGEPLAAIAKSYGVVISMISRL
jgi:hypothetical protein